MSHAIKHDFLSFEDYLEGERNGDVRHEHVDGQAEYYYAGDSFTLESVGLTMAVEAVYRRVRREVGLEIMGG